MGKELAAMPKPYAGVPREPPVVAQSAPVPTGPPVRLLLAASRAAQGPFALAVENADNAVVSALSSSCGASCQLKVLYDRPYEAASDQAYVIVKCAPFVWPSLPKGILSFGAAKCPSCATQTIEQAARAHRASVETNEGVDEDTVRIVRIGGTGITVVSKRAVAHVEIAPEHQRELASGGCVIVIRAFALGSYSTMEILALNPSGALVHRAEAECKTTFLPQKGACAVLLPVVPRGALATRRLLVDVPKGAVAVSDIAIMSFPNATDEARVAQVRAFFAQNARVVAHISALLTRARVALGFFAPLLFVP